MRRVEDVAHELGGPGHVLAVLAGRIGETGRNPRRVVAPLRRFLAIEPGEGRLQARALTRLALLDHLGHAGEHRLVVTGVAAHRPRPAARESGPEAGDLAAVLLVSREAARLLLRPGRPARAGRAAPADAQAPLP